MDNLQKLAEFNKQYGESFCIKPFTEICNTAKNNLKMCCVADSFDTANSSKTLVDAFYNHPEMNAARQKILAGEIVNECHKCYYNEKILGSSARIQHTLNLKNQDPELFDKILKTGHVEVRTMDVKFGNKCNLGCVMCSHHSSSTIGRELKNNAVSDELTKIWINDPVHEYDFDSVEFEELKQYASTIRRFAAKGGEPTLLPLFKEWIDFLVDNEYSKNIRFSTVTNATVDLSPLIEKLVQFDEFEIFWSVDAIGHAFKFLRWPATFEKVSKNHKRMIKAALDHDIERFNFGFSVVCHSLNLDQMVKIAEYADELEYVCEVYYNIAHGNDAMIPGVVSEKTLNQFKQDVGNYCQGDGKFKNQLKNLLSKVEDRYIEIHSDEDRLSGLINNLVMMTDFWKKTRGLDVNDYITTFQDTVSQIK